ncbi:hypothetical protein P154DRAFT_447235, partial [Amniculicola lignicola CBS 123094]
YPKVIILNNILIHQNNEITKVIHAASYLIQYLPLYLPNYNPIELTFNLLKV